MLLCVMQGAITPRMVPNGAAPFFKKSLVRPGSFQAAEISNLTLSFHNAKQLGQ
jgi:hypothetical protein